MARFMRNEEGEMVRLHDEEIEPGVPADWTKSQFELSVSFDEGCRRMLREQTANLLSSLQAMSKRSMETDRNPLRDRITRKRAQTDHVAVRCAEQLLNVLRR